MIDRKQWREYDSRWNGNGGLYNYFLGHIIVQTEHDFDRMQDVCRISVRGFPMDDVKTSEHKKKKHVLDLVLPEKGSPERLGADSIIAALSSILGSIRGSCCLAHTAPKTV